MTSHQQRLRLTIILACTLWLAFAEAGVSVPSVIRTTGLLPAEFGVVVNADEPGSALLGTLYLQFHGIPAANLVEVALGTGETVDRNTFEIANATVKGRLGAHVQALALTFRSPSRVGLSNSITSAFAHGYYERPPRDNYGSPGWWNPYAKNPNLVPVSRQTTDQTKPFTQFGLRPAMLVSGSGVGSSIALLLRGVNAERTRPVVRAYVMLTTDTTRNRRARNLRPVQAINSVTLTVAASNVYPDADPVLLYFQGLAVIPDLASLTYRNGAWVDTLTSCAGMLDGCGGQTTVWQAIDAGATGSYGTVEEPTNMVGKFPNPELFVRYYSSGSTLLEAAWRSVYYPYQGLFVGDPLAAPWGR